MFFFFFSSRRRHTRLQGDWSSDVCSSDLAKAAQGGKVTLHSLGQGVLRGLRHLVEARLVAGGYVVFDPAIADQRWNQRDQQDQISRSHPAKMLPQFAQISVHSRPNRRLSIGLFKD